MMRVLQVIGAMDRAGAETMIMNLYRAIDRTRVQFDFLVHEQRECDYDEEIRELGGRLHRLPRFTGVNLPTYRAGCRRLFAEYRYPVVHGHIGSSAAVYLREAKRAGSYAIAHSHAQNFLKGAPGLAFRVVAYPTRFVADHFMACSLEAGVDRFGRRVVEGGSFSLLNNGIDLSLYRCDQAAHEAAKRRLKVAGRPVFGHVGRLSGEKNHRFLFEVFSQVLRELPDAVLLLVGRGPLRGELERLAQERGLSDSVRFLGVCDDVPGVLKALDVFVFPSTKEGLAMAAVEAQAVGATCVLSTGVPEAAVVSPRVSRLDLSLGAARWARAVVEAYESSLSRDRADCVEEVRAHGFDIADTAAWLEGFYLDAAARASMRRG